MDRVPDAISVRFDSLLKKKIPHTPIHEHYRKWLRYFWDFSHKYPMPESRAEQVRLFAEKLREKGQPPNLLEQAAHAVSLYSR